MVKFSTRSLRQKLRRIKLNFRRVNFTLVGDEGKPWRRAIGIGAGLFVVLLLLIFGRAEVQLMNSPEIKSIQERGFIRVGIRRDLEGLCGQEDGLESELARRIAMKIFPDGDTGNTLELVEVSSMTAGSRLNDGSVDLVIALMSQPMASQYSFSQSYYSDPCIMVVKSGTSAFALKNVTVGYVQSNKLRITAEEYLLTAFIEKKDADKEMNLTSKPYASYGDLLMALERGEIGGAILPRLYFLKYRDSYDILETSFTVGTVDYAAMGATDSNVLASIADIVIGELRESGELDRLYIEYGLAN